MDKGAAGVDSLEKMLGQLKAPRVVWLMVPSGAPVDQTIDLLTPHWHRETQSLTAGIRITRTRCGARMRWRRRK